MDPDFQLLELAAIAADYYGLPLFGYIDHLRQTRVRYGNSAALLDLMTAVHTKEAKAERAREMADEAKRNA